MKVFAEILESDLWGHRMNDRLLGLVCFRFVV